LCPKHTGMYMVVAGVKFFTYKFLDALKMFNTHAYHVYGWLHAESFVDFDNRINSNEV